MNNELKPYNEYKKTDLLWVERIPKHWNMTRNKNVMKLQKETVGKNHSNYVLLSLTKKGIIARDLENAKGKFPKEFDTYQVVNPGDIVFCLFDIDETPRTVGLSSMSGMITGAYTVFKIENINEKYLYYYYLSIDNNKKLKPLYTGLRKVINTDTFLRTKMPIPSRDEQDKIVKYLDFQIAKINKFIKANKKLILALKEQKQAVINDAMTKGVNPNVKMKTSGIEWLGDIPEHWEIVQLRRIVKKVKTGGTPQGADEKYYSDNGFNWYTPSDFSDELELKKSTRQLSELGTKSVSIFPENTILMIGIGGTMGKIAISKDKCSCNQQINAIICDSNINNEHLVMFLRAIRKHIFATAKYTTLPILNQDETKKLPVLKLSKQEQDEIVDYIKLKTKVIDNSIEKIENEIALITEYRTSLISNVVTGKVDVRNIVIDDILKEDTNIDETEDKIIESEEDINIGESEE